MLSPLALKVYRRLVIIGVVSELNCDDAVGLLAARSLKRKLEHTPGILILEAGSLPENVTSPLRRYRPALVVLIDAADMGQPAGTIRLLPVEAITGMSFSTHTMPLSILARYLEQEIGCRVVVVGIQPASLEFCEPVSRICLDAARRLERELSRILQV